MSPPSLSQRQREQRMDVGKQPGITLGQIFLDAAHFEHRADAMSVAANTPVGDLGLQLQTQYAVSKDRRSAAIRLSVTNAPDSQALYRLSVTISALVEVKAGEENMTVEQYIATSTMALLYPFAREIVANLTWRGRFGPVWLHPLNFRALEVKAHLPTGQAESQGVATKASASKKRR